MKSKSIEISIDKIVESLLVAYVWNTKDEYIQRRIAYRLILPDNVYDEVMSIVKEKVEKGNIIPQAR